MLRVLTLSTLFPDISRPNFGVSVEQQVLAFAQRGDVDVQVVAPIGLMPGPLASRPHHAALRALPPSELWKGVMVHRPRFTVVPGAPWLSPLMLRRALAPLLRRLHREFPFDLIDAQFFFPDGPAAVPLARKLGVPCSIKARGADIDRWAKGGITRRQIVRAAARADGLLAASASLRDAMGATGIDPARIRLHHMGVDLARFAPADRAAAKAAIGFSPGPLIVSLGTLIPRKGQALVIDALADIPGAQLMLVGEGRDRAALQDRAERLGVGARVHFMGNRAHDELPSLLAAADVMVLPSASEGLANAWVESLACGTPIVIADVGAAQEVVKAPAAGRIVARSPDAIAGAVRELIANPPDQAAVRRFAERFNRDASSDTLFAHLSAIKR
ncbi:MAG: glycoside hydrolase [Sphingomonas sp. SCN 67-18]|uniref:glycosyltransferase n=1 Tax=uncultured Sphingomonas sp. TaxID=158754 RepID=UPI00086B1F2B|nr:glycosyltransferase [Sphingomonas sp. SCN 67-18]ODU20535.1 MAG: glycoside hydrolase [Sphingomonas sp. SCN 67-18]